jgi:hypothetical protein
MKMKNKFIRQLIEVEIRLGFLSIPSHGVELMPEKKVKSKQLLMVKRKNFPIIQSIGEYLVLLGGIRRLKLNQKIMLNS